MGFPTEREAKLRNFAETAIEIGRKRQKKMKKLKVALQNGEDEKALDIARDLVGLGSRGKKDEL